MADYVVAHVSMHQRLFTQYKADQKARRWVQHYPDAATEITVGIMGLGVIGQRTIEELKPLGYGLRGWSRTKKTIEDVTCFAADELDAFLGGTDILVALLPLTPETEGILNYETFRKLRPGVLRGGPAIVNAARGGHSRETDIVRALTDGTLGAASLDVFEVEPLPQDSPLWDLENCYITPHIAAISNERTGAAYFSKVILDHEAGKPLPNVVDVKRGY
jgi:glyoxylate/hydroxypyruvate reductase A